MRDHASDSAIRELDVQDLAALDDDTAALAPGLEERLGHAGRVDQAILGAYLGRRD